MMFVLMKYGVGYTDQLIMQDRDYSLHMFTSTNLSIPKVDIGPTGALHC